MSIGNGDNETIQALKDALREAVCPESTEGSYPQCRDGLQHGVISGTSRITVECPFCANRTELLGETV